MTTDTLDPVIHSPARLRIVATLAALPGGDALSVARLLAMTGLAAADLSTQLRRLEGAGYVRTALLDRDAGALPTAALTHDGRIALGRYAAALRRPRAQVPGAGHRLPAPDLRIGDADRDAAAAALGEHFAQGRLTLDELDARLDAAFTAITRRDLSRVTCDLPDATVSSALPPFTASRRDRARTRGWRS